MPSPRKLITVAHSYVLGVNRRLAVEMSAQGRGRWDVVAIAPRHFAARGDIRPLNFTPMQHEHHCRDLGDATGNGELNGDAILHTRVLPARLTNLVHVFSYDGSRLRDIMRAADLVHAWEEPYIYAGWQIARSTPAGVPLVFRSAQSLNKRYPPPFAWFERQCVSRMAGWICSGTKVEANLLGRPGYGDRPHRLIPLGVDLACNRVDRAAGREVLRQLDWADDGTPVIGFLGRFVHEKGLSLLTHVLDSLPRERKWRAMFVGNGAMEPALRAWAMRRNRADIRLGRSADRVRLCTDVSHDDVPNYLNAMSVLTAPSQTTRRWREQFGRMIIEAFACGVPVVGSDSGEIPSLVEDAGIIAPEKSIDAWINAIDGLLTDESRRQELIGRGLERAGRFNWSRIARQHLDFFDEIMSENRCVDDTSSVSQ